MSQQLPLLNKCPRALPPEGSSNCHPLIFPDVTLVLYPSHSEPNLRAVNALLLTTEVAIFLQDSLMLKINLLNLLCNSIQKKDFCQDQRKLNHHFGFKTNKKKNEKNII